jgi:hypothetical protein
MDRLLKRIQRVRPTAFCSPHYFLLHDNATAHKAAFANFWPPPKMLQPFITPPPVLSRFISARLFSLPQVENELKRAPLCGCYLDPRSRNWWINEVQKEEFMAAFQKLYDRAKACIYASGAYFEYKKICLPRVCSFKKVSPKTFGPHCTQQQNAAKRSQNFTMHWYTNTV